MADLTTADVYEDASLIGQDIEKLIQRFGHDAVLDLMPKVVCVLEKLEVVVCEREKDKLEIAELKLENERLYWEITKEATQRRKLDEELYQLSASGESDNLKSMLVKLQEENRRLRLEYEVSANTQPVTAYISAPGDAELMHKMKETIDNQRDTIRVKNQEIDSQRNDIEAIGEQIERLTSINQSVRRSLASSQERISALAKEKAELQTELQAYRRTSQPQNLNANSGEDSEGNESFTDSEAELEENGKSMSQELEEEKEQTCEDEDTETSFSSSGKPPPKPPRLHLELEVKEDGDELNNNDKNVLPDGEKENSEEIKANGLENESDEAEWEFVERQKPLNKEEKTEKLNGRGKEGRAQNEKERKDPNRPRYTKAELLEILIERNKLKEKVWALKEELAIYKPRSDTGGGEDGKLRTTTPSPRKESRKEDSGISRIFNIFARKGEA